MTELRPGAVLLLGAEASPQFVVRPLTLRLVAVLPRITYDGWVWLSGYALDRRGNATAKREVYVLRSGIVVVSPAPVAPTTRQAPRRPVTVPR